MSVVGGCGGRKLVMEERRPQGVGLSVCTAGNGPDGELRGDDRMCDQCCYA